MSKSVWKVTLLAIISVALVPCAVMAQTPWSYANSNTLYADPNVTNVGIGTQSPAPYGLMVFSGTSNSFFGVKSATGFAGFIMDRGNATTAASSLNFRTAGVDNFIEGIGVYAAGTDFQIGNNSVPFLTITTAGKVGIGTATPNSSYALDVVGSIHATNVIGASYQDFAEWVPASEQMSAGTVVVLNREKNNEVLPSTSAYDSTVAGVVSAKPGIILGDAASDKAQIATTGRVRVKVDATRAPIQIGDLLVTSDVAGTAMKSEPIEIQGRRFHQPGTIVGKALEPLSSGKGEILVLLSLQ